MSQRAKQGGEGPGTLLVSLAMRACEQAISKQSVSSYSLVFLFRARCSTCGIMTKTTLKNYK